MMKAASSALPALWVRSVAETDFEESVPKPPRITLMKERFIARHMM